MRTITKEELKHLSFDSIDEKIKFINSNKYLCKKLFKDLNKEIDKLYVRNSEALELSYTCKDTEFYKQALEDLKSFSDLTCIFKNEQGEIHDDVLLNPDHLSAFVFALKRAKKDKDFKKNEGFFEDVQPRFVEEVHKELFKHEEEIYGERVGYGNFRRTVFYNGAYIKANVRITNDAWIPSDANTVKEDVYILCNELNNSTLHPIAKAVLFMTRLAQIQPFRDGNKRTSRIFLNYILARENYPTVVICAKHKDQYINALITAISEDNYAPMIDIVCNSLNKICDFYIEQIKEYTLNSEDVLKN